MTALLSLSSFAEHAQVLLAASTTSENEVGRFAFGLALTLQLHGRLLQVLRLLQALTLPAEAIALGALAQWTA